MHPASVPIPGKLACIMALRVTEVLELVLAQMTYDELLRVGTFSPKAREVILDSPTLQKIMFMRPVPKQQVLEWRMEPMSSDTTLATGQWKPWLFTSGTDRAPSKYEKVVLMPHPSLERREITRVRYSSRAKKHFSFCFDGASLVNTQTTSLRRRMFVTQPPLKTGTVEYAIHYRQSGLTLTERKQIEVEVAGGITFGDIAGPMQGELDRLTLDPDVEAAWLHGWVRVTSKGYVAYDSVWVSRAQQDIS